MQSKSPAKTFYHRSPILCCNCILSVFYSPLLRAALLTAVVVFLAAAVVFVICGALYTPNYVAYYAVSVILFVIALLLLSLYVWVNRCLLVQTIRCPHQVHDSKPTVSTISTALDYYNQLPPGKTTDFPMGPHLVMTLPRPSRARTRQNSGPSEDSPAFTKKIPSRPKNVPPLASEETLSPSLDGSSCPSINSVI